MKLFLLCLRRRILEADIENGVGLIDDHQRRLDNLKLEHMDRKSELRRVDARIVALERPRSLISKAIARRQA